MNSSDIVNGKVIPNWIVADVHTHGSDDCRDKEGNPTGNGCDFENWTCFDLSTAGKVTREDGTHPVAYLFTPEGTMRYYDPNSLEQKKKMKDDLEWVVDEDPCNEGPE